MSQVTFDIDTEGFAELEKNLKALMPMAMGRKGYAKNPLRSAMRKGANIIMEDAKQRAPVNPRTKSSLRDAIQIALIPTAERDAAIMSGNSVEGYDIGYRSKKSSSKAYAPYGGWVELGTDKTPAQPYLRPALQGSGQKAVSEVGRAMDTALKLIAKKLKRDGVIA